MRKMSFVSCFIVWVLVFQIGVGQFALQAVAAPGDNDKSNPSVGASSQPTGMTPEMVTFENAALNADANTPAPKSVDVNRLTRQFHRTYYPALDDKGNSFDRVQREIPLSRIDLTNPDVTINNWARQTKIVYDEKTKELTILKIIYDEELKRERATDGHVFTNITLTSNLVQNANYVLAATENGIEGFLWRDIMEYAFKAPISVPILLPLPPKEFGATITNLELLSRASKPREIGNAELIDEGDIAVKFTNKSESGETHAETRVDLKEIVTRFRINQLALLGLLQIANPDLDEVQPAMQLLRENAADLAKYQKEQEKLLGNGEKNDLLQHSLSNIAQKGMIKKLLELFKKNRTGQDSFEELAVRPRDRFSGDSKEGSSWQKDYAKIQALQDSDSTKDSGKSWKEKLADEYNNSSVRELRERAIAEKMLISRYYTRIKDAFYKHVTPTRMKVLAAVIAGTALDYAYGGGGIDWMMATATRIFTWSTQLPMIGPYAQQVHGSMSYLNDGWRFLYWAGAAGAICSLYPLSMLAGKALSFRDGRGWSALRTFFSYGIRAYATLNYPIQKIFYDTLRQKNLYPALTAGLNPLKNKAAWNSPFASQKTIEANSEKLRNTLETNATRKSRALILAAAIVAEAHRNEGEVPIDIATLIMSAQGAKVETIANIAALAGANTRWTELTHDVYSALAQMTEEVSTDVDEKALEEYHKIFTSHSERLRQEVQNGTTVSMYLKRKLGHLWTRGSQIMSRNVVPFVLYGKQGYDLFRRYQKAEVDEKTSKIAGTSYRIDFLTSNGVYALTAAAKYGDLLRAGPAAAEVLTNELSQVFIYGVQGAIDPLSAAAPDRFVHESRPLTDFLYARSRERQQTMFEGLRSMASGAVDPHNLNHFDNHANYIENSLTGLQVRLAADYVTRSLGVFFTPGTEEKPKLNFGEAFRNSAPISLYFLLNKISFSTGAVGFAVVWPYVHLAMRHMEDATERNLLRIQYADYCIDVGTRLGDLKNLHEGVRTMQELFKEGRIELPERFQLAPEQFTHELALRLHEYSLEKIPLPTQASNGMIRILNYGLGAFMSTLLFDKLSGEAFAMARDPNSNFLTLLTHTIMFVGSTYVGLRAAGFVTPYVVHGVQWMKNKVEKTYEGICTAAFSQFSRGIRRR